MLNKNNNILINKDFYPETGLIITFLKGLGLIPVFEYDKIKQYQFIIDDFHPEIVNIKRLKLNKNCLAITDAYIDPDMISNTLIQQLLHFRLKETKSNDLFDEVTVVNTEIVEFKIQDYLNTGFITDRVVQAAYSHSVNYINIRNYLNAIFESLLSNLKPINERPLFNLTYAFSNNLFITKVELNVDFNAVQLQKNFTVELAKLSNYVSVDSSLKESKIIITGCWFVDESIKNYHTYFSENIDNQESLNIHFAKRKNGLLNDEVDFNGFKYVQQNIDPLTLAKRLVFYIKRIIRFEENLSIDKMSIDDIDYLLRNYPNKNILTNVNDEIKQLMIKLINDGNLDTTLNDFIHKFSGSSLNDQLPEIKRILGDKSISDIQESIIVKGNYDSLDQVLLKVKAWAGDSKGISNNDVWEVKKLNIMDKLSQEIGRLNFIGSPIVLDDLVKIVSTEINANHDDIYNFMEEIAAESISVTTFGNKSIDVCLDLLKEKETALGKTLEENKKLKELSVKAMKAFKELQNKQFTGDSKIIQLHGNNQDSEEIDTLKAKQRIDDERIKNMSSTIEKMEKILKMKDAELQIAKMRKEAVKPEVSKFDSTFIAQKTINVEENPIFLKNELKKTENKLNLSLSQLDDLRKRKLETDQDLIEKKKELQKMKNENNALSLKILEFERKANSDLRRVA
jgi:hypothetical protein